MQINSAKLIVEILDETTGELITREATLGDFKEVKKSSSTRTKKVKDDGSTEPKVILLEGKIQLNNRAMELTGWEPEMKIDIDDNLEEFGSEFDLIPYEGHEGWFKMIGNIEQPEDDTVEIPEEISNPDVDDEEESSFDIGDFSFDLDEE